MVALLGLACAGEVEEVAEVPAPEPTTEALAAPSEAEPEAEPAEPSPAAAPTPAAKPVTRSKIVTTTKPVAAAPAPAPSSAYVTIEGDAKEVLLLPDSQGAQRSSGGSTAAGAYKVKAWFKQPVPVIAANITLQPGERAVISCSSASKRCEKRQAE